MQDNSDIINAPKKLSKEIWLQHVQQWQQSNLSQQTYCAQAGINYGTFVYWRGQYLQESGQIKQRHFAPVKVNQSQPDIMQSIKVKLISGVVISIPCSMDVMKVAELIRQLELTHA